jgi:hypothetical protein
MDFYYKGFYYSSGRFRNRDENFKSSCAIFYFNIRVTNNLMTNSEMSDLRYFEGKEFFKCLISL